MKRLNLVMLIAAFVCTANTANASDFGFKGLEARGGVVLPQNWDPGWTGGIGLDLGEIIDHLRLFGGLGYSKSGDSDLDWSITDIAVGAEVRYYLEREAKGFYFGAGAYQHFINTDFGNTNRVSPVGIAGYRWPSQSGAFMLEARYETGSIFRGPQLLAAFAFGL